MTCPKFQFGKAGANPGFHIFRGKKSNKNWPFLCVLSLPAEHHLAMTPTGSSYLSQVIPAHVTSHVTPPVIITQPYSGEKCNTAAAQYITQEEASKKKGDYSAPLVD